MLELSWIRVIVALGAFALWSLGAADVRAEEVSSVDLLEQGGRGRLQRTA